MVKIATVFIDNCVPPSPPLDSAQTTNSHATVSASVSLYESQVSLIIQPDTHQLHRPVGVSCLLVGASYARTYICLKFSCVLVVFDV